jgi:protein phosphatase
MIARFTHASHAIQGSRELQEDACAFAFPDTRALYFTSSGRVNGTGDLLAVLADGMGGHVAGAEASRVVCRTFIEAYSASGSKVAEGRRLKAALDQSNLAIAEAVARNRALEGMGSTLLAVLFGERGLRWISVGDSPLYLFRHRHLIQLNQDHSLAPVLDRLAAAGEILPEEAVAHPRRHFLRSALTGGPIDLVDLRSEALPLEAGDWVVLASDGLETLSHSEIANSLARHSDGDAIGLARGLLSAVEAARHPQQDNATVMAIRPVLAETAVA